MVYDGTACPFLEGFADMVMPIESLSGQRDIQVTRSQRPSVRGKTFDENVTGCRLG